MVDALHAAGIEVVLDVVYNHTCEQGVDGISLSWRGLDAPRLLPARLRRSRHRSHRLREHRRRTVARRRPDDRRGLRYWAHEMGGVDGFRFDLASALGRPGGGRFDSRASIFSAITADPVLSRCKLIAEPWDATSDGYRVGHFGVQWSEWNDKYRNTVRRFWNGGTGGTRSRLPGGGFRGRVRKPAPVGVRQFRDRARRFHRRGPRVVPPQTQRGERRGQPGRRRSQRLRRPRRRRPHRRSVDHRGAVPARPRAPGHARTVDRHADVHRRRRVRSHPRRQQQRVLRPRRHPA